MKLPPAAVRKAAAKRHRAAETPGAGTSAPPPKRLVVRVPDPPQAAPAPQAVDLTADTPPEGTTAEVPATEVAADEPRTGEPAGETRTPDEPSPSWTGVEPEATGRPSEQAVSPPRAVPPPAEAAEGSQHRPIARSASLMNDGRRAERLLAQIIQPDFQEELRGIGATRFFREAASALVRVANSFALTREAIGEGDAFMNQLQQDVEDAQARAEAAEKALEETRANCAGEIRGAEDRASEAIEQQRVALNRVAEVEGAIEARNLRIADLESLLQLAKETVREAGDNARGAEERAKKAEEGEMRATALLAAERESRASEVEVAVREGAIKAVEDFRSSDLFAREVLEGNADSYLQGFREAKERIARVLNVPGALEINPSEDSDEASSGGPAADS